MFEVTQKKGVQIMIKKFIIAVLLCTVASLHAVEYDLEDFMEGNTSMDVGYVNIDSESFFKLGLQPNLSFKALELGLNLNIYLPLGDQSAPDLSYWLAIRRAGINFDDKYGLEFGRLKNVTLGQGLLVDGFDSGSGGSTEFNQDKAGAKGFITVFDTKITAMYTLENVQALRIERPAVEIASTPVIVGATFAEDTDGVDDDSSGTQVSRDKQSGYAADISYPIGGEILTLFAEYSELTDQGSGAAAGMRGSLFELVTYKAEVRQLGTGFVPGYFNSTYQQTSFDFESDALTEKTTGFLVNVGTSLMEDYIKASAQYELYDDINVGSVAIGWRQIGPVTGVVNMVKPFNVENSSGIVVANLFIKTGKMYDLVVRQKYVFETADDYEQSTEVAVSFNTDSFLPF